MKQTDSVERQRGGVQKPVVKKHVGPIYKFSKRNGKNCGALQKDEKRDRELYDYSDEM